ncbi:MAG: type II toxin-antitoxin system HicA family toxin [Phycisphaerales bacterium]|jgi:predicted RNA binding protein YcfA (HicA-like mRNA interferase family)|nr:type II toxin-antitoxin system HicA family toxin [Phycisphaerales bacterium]MDP6890830.1 type II toxin-antitoxin system HicA family toxin [Phycisphaerales bacterium]
MPSDIPFKRIRKRLEHAGWRLDRIRGSHHVFTHPGCTPIVIPVHGGKVKAGYERQIKKRLGEE